MRINISKPPVHRWQPITYKHIAPPDTLLEDASNVLGRLMQRIFGSVASQIERAVLGIANTDVSHTLESLVIPDMEQTEAPDDAEDEEEAASESMWGYVPDREQLIHWYDPEFSSWWNDDYHDDLDDDDKEALAQREAENGIENLERSALTLSDSEALEMYNLLRDGECTTEEINGVLETIYNKRKQER